MKYYDEIATGYDELYKDEQLAKIALIKKELSLTKETKLLDLGCGPYYGDWGCDVVGVDPAQKLLDKAAQKGIKTVCAKAESLPFPDNAFDYCVSITAAQNFTDPQQGFNEIKRVSKHAIITFLKGVQKAPFLSQLVENTFTVQKKIESDKDLVYVVVC